MVKSNAERSIPRGQSWGGCRVCKHFQPDMTCIAFPRRIPIAIASGELDHLVVRPGQVGEITWELGPNPTGLAARLIAAACARGEAWAAGQVPMAGSPNER